MQIHLTVIYFQLRATEGGGGGEGVDLSLLHRYRQQLNVLRYRGQLILLINVIDRSIL